MDYPHLLLQQPELQNDKLSQVSENRLLGAYLQFRVEKKKIIIEPIDEKKGILSLAGKFKVKNPIPAEKIRDYIDYSWGKR